MQEQPDATGACACCGVPPLLPLLLLWVRSLAAAARTCGWLYSAWKPAGRCASDALRYSNSVVIGFKLSEAACECLGCVARWKPHLSRNSRSACAASEVAARRCMASRLKQRTATHFLTDRSAKARSADGQVESTCPARPSLRISMQGIARKASTFLLPANS